MRPLTDEETKVFFEKLAIYIGRNIKSLLDRSDERYCFRLHRMRVYYVSERIMRMATNISRENLALMGTCFGKFSASGKFRLRITALDHLVKHAKHKVWVKPSAEMTFLYGNNVSKSGLARMTEGVAQNAGVVILSMNETPLGFGLAAKSTEGIQDMDPTQNAILWQADIGEFVRAEEDLM